LDGTLFVRGLVLGFTIAAAVGPISLLTIRRTLADGWRVGFASGLGVATADAAYGAVAAFGLTAISGLLVSQARLLALVGGAFLIVLGARTLRSPAPATAARSADSRGLVSAYASILALTLTNPMTILSFAALFVGLGLVAGDAAGAALLVAGVFAGSLCWWVVLTATTTALRSRVTPTALRWLNVGSGAVIVAFGVVALGTAVRG